MADDRWKRKPAGARTTPRVFCAANATAFVAAFGALATLVFLVPGAHAGEPRVVPEWAGLPQLSAESFASGPQAAWRARARGAKAASDVVPSNLRAIDIETRWDLPIRPEVLPMEMTVDAMLTWRLGGEASKQRAALDGDARVAEANLERARFGHFNRVLEAYRRWWTAREVANHIKGHRDALGALLAPIRAATDAGRLSRLVASDLEVEAARSGLEYRAQRRRVSLELARLRQVVGLPELVSSGSASASESGASNDHEAAATLDASSLDNPWDGIASRLAQAHPDVATLTAKAAALRSSAVFSDASNPVSLQAGLGIRQLGSEVTWTAVIANLSIPLGNRSAPQAERLRAEAIASEAAADYRSRVIALDIALRAQGFGNAVARLNDLKTQLLPAMEARVALMEAGLAVGRVSLEQVVRARRDLLEVEHSLVEATAEVMAQSAEASAVRAWLAATGA